MLVCLPSAQVASNWALANPGANAVMCCIEICSAEYVWNKHASPELQMKLAVTNSLFGDGCTAAVVRCDPEPKLSYVPPPMTQGRLNIQLLGYESYMIPSSLDTLYLEWDEVTSKFSFFLTSDVPYAIGEHMPLMINALLKRFGLSKKDIAHWVVHSGGKKVRACMRAGCKADPPLGGMLPRCVHLQEPPSNLPGIPVDAVGDPPVTLHSGGTR